jgi:hypothetical protein
LAGDVCNRGNNFWVVGNNFWFGGNDFISA